jgi:hypothetical protein
MLRLALLLLYLIGSAPGLDGGGGLDPDGYNSDGGGGLDPNG